MARFYASDVLYKDYTTRCDRRRAARGRDRRRRHQRRSRSNAGQFLPDLGWLTPAFVATKLARARCLDAHRQAAAPGTHGHSLRLGQRRRHDAADRARRTRSRQARRPRSHSTSPTAGQNNETNVVVQGDRQRHERQRPDDRPPDHRGAAARPCQRHPQLVAAAGHLHGHGDGRAGARREEHAPTTRSPSRSHSSSRRRPASGGPGARSAANPRARDPYAVRVHDLTSTAGIVAIAAAALAVVCAAHCARALALRLRRRARRSARRPRRAAARTSSPTPRSFSAQFEALSQYVQDAARAAERRMELAERAPRRRGGLPRTGPLRRLRRDVGAPVDVDRAARRDALRRRAVLDPPPRPGAAVRQAGARRGSPSSSSRPRRTRRSGSRSRAPTGPSREPGRG